MQTRPQINMLIPLYNEEDVFNKLVTRLKAVMDQSDLSITVIMVDDGSEDKTSSLMEEVSTNDPRFSAVFLSRNFGHQLALTAALSCVDATEAVLVLDGDLQDPPELLDEFYSHYKDGYDVVYAERSSQQETFFKRKTSALFYKTFNWFTNINIPLNAGDFGLISIAVVNAMNQMKEQDRFMRGLRSWVGYKQKGIYFDRDKRAYGETKYTFKKMNKLALDGIFSFSDLPIKIISKLGLITVLIGLAYFGTTMFKKIFFGTVTEGFTGLIFAIILFGGVQLLSIGILGEYILRIYFQVKERPLFIIKKQIKNGEAVL